MRGNIPNQRAKGIRLSVSKSGCSGLKYVTDCFTKAHASDCVFEDKGLVVAIDEASIDYLKGMSLDYKEIGPGQTQLLYHNPNATDTCGCGESFRWVEDQTEDKT